MWSSDIDDWTAYLKELGEATSLELLEHKEQDAQRRYTYRATFRGSALVLSLGLRPDNKIAYIDETPEE
jgi:hypothetical protein